VWWADVEDVRVRIERRREREARLARAGGVGAQARTDGARAIAAPKRGVREIRPGARLTLVRTNAPPARNSRGRPRARLRPIDRVGPRPDRVAAWAVLLGFLLVLAAVLSAHG
jgi:hypothetical protein